MIKCAVQKAPVAGNMGYQFSGFLGIGHIAAAAAGNPQLPAKPGAFVHQQNCSSMLRCCYAGHKPGRSASDNNYIIVAAHKSAPLHVKGTVRFAPP
ncbi:hypothetical protein D3C87_1694000 [compost metagenome]